MALNGIVLILALSVATKVVAQTLEETKPQVITSSRPMRDISNLLQGIYLRPFTYEDPFWIWSGDIGPREGWKGQYPIDRSFLMPFQLDSHHAPELDAALLNSIVDAYNHQADGPHVRLYQDEVFPLTSLPHYKYCFFSHCI